MYKIKATLLIVLLAAGCKIDNSIEQAKKTFSGYEKFLPSSPVNTASIDTSNMLTINIPDFSNKAIPAIDFDQLIDSIHYVKLETNNKCLIGNVDKIIALEDKLIIVDRVSNESAFMFSNEGAFLFEIGRKGNGPGEYTSLRDVAVNENKKEILLFDGRGQKILYFDWNGKFLRAQSTYFYATDFIVLQNGNYLFKQIPGVNVHLTELTDYNLIYTNPKGIIINKAFPDEISVNFPKLADLGSQNFNNVGSGILFSPLLSDIVYELKGDDILAKYHLNMNDKFVPKKLNQQSTLQDYNDKINLQKLYDVGSPVLETETCLFFTISNLGSCFYKKKSGKLFCGNSFTYSNEKIITASLPVSSTGSFFISVLWPHSLFTANIRFEASVEQMLKNTKANDNPIFSFYTIKK